MKNKYEVPPLIEEMCQKLLDEKTSVWQRQYYEKTMRDILSYTQSALNTYDTQKKQEMVKINQKRKK